LCDIISEKARARDRKCDDVGVMKDKELKLEDIEDPHKLGETSYMLLRYVDLAAKASQKEAKASRR
jgi:hypothetical protein